MKKTNEEIQKEIETIIKNSNTPDEALNNICKAFPEVDNELLRKSFDEERKKAEESFSKSEDSEDIQNLSEEDLEAVAGGSFGSWMKKTWTIVVGAAAIITVGAVCWKKGYSSKASADMVKDERLNGKTTAALDTLDRHGFDFDDYKKYK